MLAFVGIRLRAQRAGAAQASGTSTKPRWRFRPTPKPLARGEHIAITRGCTDCHGADLGGNVIFEVPAIGRMAAPNLTRGKGGVTAGFQRRATGSARSATASSPTATRCCSCRCAISPALSDADTADLIAYVQQRRRSIATLAPSYIGPVGRALFAFGQLPMLEARLIDQHAAHVARIENRGDRRLRPLSRARCIGCHGEHFSGGPIPGAPPDFPKPANITPDAATGIGAWTKDDFYRVFREGKKRDGSALDPFMPWQALGHFTDTELDALWAYLRTVPARPHGQR